MEIDDRFAALACRRAFPSFVRVQDNQVCADYGATVGPHGNFDMGRGRFLRRGGDDEENFRVVYHAVFGRLPAKRPSFAHYDWNAVAPALHNVHFVLRPLNIAHRHSSEHGCQDLIAGGLSNLHAVRRKVAGKRAGRLDFKSVCKNGNPNPAAHYGIIAMRHSVDYGLEQRFCAVLRHVYSPQLLARRDPHVADCKGHRVGNLLVKWTNNFSCINLSRSSIGSSVPSCHDARVGQPLLWVLCAE